MSFSPEMIIKPSLIWFRRSTNSLSFSSESMKREKYVSGILPEIRQKEFRKSFDNILVMYTLRSRASGICYQSIKYGPVLRILHRQPSVEILQCFGRGFCMVFTIGTRNRLFQAVSYDRFQNTFICVVVSNDHMFWVDSRRYRHIRSVRGGISGDIPLRNRKKRRSARKGRPPFSCLRIKPEYRHGQT